jgi:hypothetical protein
VIGVLHRTSYTARDGQERGGWSVTVESFISARTARPGGRRQTDKPRQGRRATRPSIPAPGPLPDDRVDDPYAGTP